MAEQFTLSEDALLTLDWIFRWEHNPPLYQLGEDPSDRFDKISPVPEPLLSMLLNTAFPGVKPHDGLGELRRYRLAARKMTIVSLESMRIELNGRPMVLGNIEREESCWTLTPAGEEKARERTAAGTSKNGDNKPRGRGAPQKQADDAIDKVIRGLLDAKDPDLMNHSWAQVLAKFPDKFPADMTRDCLRHRTKRLLERDSDRK